MAEVDRATPLLASYERIKKIAVLPRDFDIERGEITPSLKVRRANVTAEYQDADRRPVPGRRRRTDADDRGLTRRRGPIRRPGGSGLTGSGLAVQ